MPMNALIKKVYPSECLQRQANDSNGESWQQQQDSNSSRTAGQQQPFCLCLCHCRTPLPHAPQAPHWQTHTNNSICPSLPRLALCPPASYFQAKRPGGCPYCKTADIAYTASKCHACTSDLPALSAKTLQVLEGEDDGAEVRSGMAWLAWLSVCAVWVWVGCIAR